MRQPRPCCALAASCYVMAVALFSGATLGQVRRPSQPSIGPTVEESLSVQSLLRTAEDAVQRADWKLVIDSLQRVINEPDGLLPVGQAGDKIRFESPRRYAQRQLAALPLEGLEAYRLLHDGRAKRLLERGIADHNLSSLQELCGRYLLTRHGPQAANLLGSWLLDLYRPAEALQVLNDLLDAYPSEELDQVEVELKRATALALLGDRNAARQALANADAAVNASRPREAMAAVMAAVEQFVANPPNEHDLHARALVEWPAIAGAGSGRGVMDPVVPSMAEGSPWRYELPSAHDRLWEQISQSSLDIPPVGFAVVSDGRLFAKSEAECTAIDLESFAVLWTAQGAAEGIPERRLRTSTAASLHAESVFWDYVGRSLSTAHGLVFSIESGDPPLMFAADGVATIRRRGVRNRSARTVDMTNRLVAYDATNGSVRWQRGRASDPDDRLQRARFLAPPVAVGSELWAPLESSGDLYAGVFRPEDGKLDALVVLCSLGGRKIEQTLALFPTVVDGVVYVASDQGLFFAIDAEQRQLRWATRYNTARRPATNSRISQRARLQRRWLSGPPVVTGRLVLLGPTDEDRLLAFDRLNGQLLWSLPRKGHQYIIAADSQRAWLGGPDISSVSLADGSYEWTKPVDDPTGRAILSGRTIYVPTRTNLLSLAADSGEIETVFDLPIDQPPLGNLLCLGDSMFSVDPTWVRSFPDRKSYSRTLAAHQANPTDARLGIRLAFMELLEGRPAAAYEALRLVALGDGPQESIHLQHVSHLRVESLIRMANTPNVDIDQALGHLHQAVNTAVNRVDSFAAQLALGDKLRRVGRYKEAYRTLWALARSSLGEEMVLAGPVRRRARTLVADRLGRIEPELGPGEVEELVAEAHQVFDTARAAVIDGTQRSLRSSGARTLLAIAESGTLGGMDRAALNALGQFELTRRRKRYEPAEQYLQESLRRHTRSHKDDWTAPALRTLVELYLQADQSLVLAARDAAKRLADEFSPLPLSTGTVGDWARRQLAALDATVMEAHAAAIEVPSFDLSADRAWRLDARIGGAPAAGGPVPHLLDIRSDRPEAMADRLLFLSSPEVLQAYRVSDGTQLWEAELRLDNDFSFGLDNTQRARSGDLTGWERRTVLIDGQTALINSPKGLHAVGIKTGRRLWAKPFKGDPYFLKPPLRDETTDAQNGRVACMMSPGLLSVLRVLDGTTLWERGTRGTPIGAVRIRDGMVLAVDPIREHVSVYRLRDGQVLCRVKFRQPNKELLLPIEYVDGVLCGAEGRSILAYDARTGDLLWSLPLNDDAVGLFEVADDLLVASAASGRHWLIEARSGKVLFNEVITQCPAGAIDGVIESGVLILTGFQETVEGNRWSIVGLDAQSGQVRWSDSFVGYIESAYLRMARGVMPVIASVRDTGAGVGDAATLPRFRPEILIINKKTGERIGDAVVWEGDRAGETLTGKLDVWPGRLLLQSKKGITALKTKAEALSASELKYK